MTPDDTVWAPDVCTLPQQPAYGLRPQAKLVEVQAKIADLEIIADALRSAIDAGCDDPIACSGEPCCPIPFATIAVGEPHAAPR